MTYKAMYDEAKEMTQNEGFADLSLLSVGFIYGDVSTKESGGKSGGQQKGGAVSTSSNNGAGGQWRGGPSRGGGVGRGGRGGQGWGGQGWSNQGTARSGGYGGQGGHGDWHGGRGGHGRGPGGNADGQGTSEATRAKLARTCKDYNSGSCSSQDCKLTHGCAYEVRPGRLCWRDHRTGEHESMGFGKETWF